MIPALSPLPNLLAPTPAMPVIGDPAAFGLLLAAADGTAVGRQITVPTGKAVPLSAALLPTTCAPPDPFAVDGLADAPPPAPNVPAAPAPAFKPPVTIPRSSAWARVARPEASVSPVAQPPAGDEAEQADPGTAILSMPVVGHGAAASIVPVPMDAEREQGDPDREHAPDLGPPSAAVALRTPPGPAMLSRADGLGSTESPARHADDDPRPSLPLGPASPPAFGSGATAMSVPAPFAPAPLPPDPKISAARVAHVASFVPGATEIPAVRSPASDLAGATAPAFDPGSVRAPVADGSGVLEVVRATGAATTLAVTSDQPVRISTAAPTAMTPGRVVLPSAPSPIGKTVEAVPPIIPAPQAIVQVALPVSVTPVPASPVAAGAALAVAAPPPSATPPVETIVPSPGPRADTEPAAPDRSIASMPPIATGVPAPTIARTVMSGPARQVFAADLRRAPRDPRPVAGEALASTVHPAPLGAAAAPAPAPIDMRQDRWPFQMAERIERLRDAADAADTRIRLIPDALGSIDVSVKRDGDTVHVHFTAEQAATRALLADAAPRLAEAAEARGLKLGQTAVGGDGSQPNGRQPQPQQPSAPAPTRPRAAATVAEDAADTRIA